MDRFSTMNAISTADISMRQTSSKPRGLARSVIAWLPLMVFPAAAYSLTVRHVAPWQLMWLISAAIYFSFKWLAWRSVCLPKASTTRKTAWWIGWMGMDPVRFLSSAGPAAERRPNVAEWRYTATNVLTGAAVFVSGAYLIATGWPYAGGWCGMFGVVLVLHFGLFHAISCAWRAAGVNALPIMDRPLTSASLGEFWGRRWNRAFRDAGYAALFQPVAKRWGATAAMLAVFLFSGIIHEAGISVPAGGGYGLPTLYFVLQAVMLLVENSARGKRAGLGHGRRGHLFTLLTVFGPLAILFHPPFVHNVIVPMMETLM
jgi:hypothetical protein